MFKNTFPIENPSFSLFSRQTVLLSDGELRVFLSTRRHSSQIRVVPVGGFPAFPRTSPPNNDVSWHNLAVKVVAQCSRIHFQLSTQVSAHFVTYWLRDLTRNYECYCQQDVTQTCVFSGNFSSTSRHNCDASGCNFVIKLVERYSRTHFQSNAQVSLHFVA